MDGSSKYLVEVLEQAGIVEKDVERDVYEVTDII